MRSHHIGSDTSRHVIDVAIGILVGLRGCSERQAFDELVHVVNQTGMGIGSVADSLVALAAGTSDVAHSDAFAGWGELIRRRQQTPLPAMP